MEKLITYHLLIEISEHVHIILYFISVLITGIFYVFWISEELPDNKTYKTKDLNELVQGFVLLITLILLSQIPIINIIIMFFIIIIAIIAFSILFLK